MLLLLLLHSQFLYDLFSVVHAQHSHVCSIIVLSAVHVHDHHQDQSATCILNTMCVCFQSVNLQFTTCAHMCVGEALISLQFQIKHIAQFVLVKLCSVAVLIEIKVFVVHVISGDGTHKATNKQMQKI